MYKRKQKNFCHRGICMILSLYIIHESGPCIFKREYGKNIEVDEQLISGFLMAVRTFAQETFLDGLQRIHLASGRRLIYGYNREYGILAAAISEKDDHPKLVEKLLDTIVKMFVKKYKEHLKPLNPSLNIYKGFKDDVDKLILSKIKPRDKITYTAAMLMSGLSILVMVYIEILLVPILGTEYGSIYVFISVLIPTALGAFVGGDRKIGVLCGVIVGVIYLLLFSPALFGATPTALPLDVYLLFAQIFIPFSILIGMITGYYGELSKLTAPRVK